jgi:REP element-mobilizing transposase RayT
MRLWKLFKVYLEKDMYVWKQISENRKLWTDAELLDSLNYINEIRVKEYRLDPLTIKL